MKSYCTQNSGNCNTCSLVNYGLDCMNNPIFSSAPQDKNVVFTASGPVKASSKSAYGKWLRGWQDGGGWTGHGTLSDSFKRAQELKDSGVSWYMLGKVMASEQAFGKTLNKDFEETFSGTIDIIAENNISDEMLRRIKGVKIEKQIPYTGSYNAFSYSEIYRKEINGKVVERTFDEMRMVDCADWQNWNRTEYVDAITVDDILIAK